MGYDASATLGFGVQFKRLEETGGTDEAVEFPEWVEHACWSPYSETSKHIMSMTSGDGRGSTSSSTLYFIRSSITVDTYDGTLRVPNLTFSATAEESLALANIIERLVAEDQESYKDMEWGWFMATLYT